VSRYLSQIRIVALIDDVFERHLQGRNLSQPRRHLARAWYLEYAGMANVARIPMIATTISSSIR
jgi:hypothetical protein